MERSVKSLPDVMVITKKKFCHPTLTQHITIGSLALQVEKNGEERQKASRM
jgi:hypothetical protein